MHLQCGSDTPNAYAVPHLDSIDHCDGNSISDTNRDLYSGTRSNAPDGLPRERIALGGL